MILRSGAIVEQKGRLIYVGDKEILSAVAVEVRGVHPHAGLHRSLVGEAHAREEPDLFPLIAAAIQPQKVLNGCRWQQRGRGSGRC